MKHATDIWLKSNIAKCIDDRCSPAVAANRLGISKETAIKYYKIVMLEKSQRAVSFEHGSVRVFISESWGCYFIFGGKNDNLLDNPKIGAVNWKCPPLT